MVKMQDASYYVYALKDPRSSPARPFYIGKGVGSRSHDHLARIDNTRKGMRIRDIQESGSRVLIVPLIENLTESQAIKLEAEIISAFGTEATGGLLTNAVVPSGLAAKSRSKVTVPSGCIERSQIGLALLTSAVLEFVRANPQGVTNSDTASLLGLRSEYRGGSKDYLSYSILGLLLREGKITRLSPSLRHVSQID